MSDTFEAVCLQDFQAAINTPGIIQTYNPVCQIYTNRYSINEKMAILISSSTALSVVATQVFSYCSLNPGQCDILWEWIYSPMDKPPSYITTADDVIVKYCTRMPTDPRCNCLVPPSALSGILDAYNRPYYCWYEGCRNDHTYKPSYIRDQMKKCSSTSCNISIGSIMASGGIVHILNDCTLSTSLANLVPTSIEYKKPSYDNLLVNTSLNVPEPPLYFTWYNVIICLFFFFIVSIMGITAVGPLVYNSKNTNNTQAL